MSSGLADHPWMGSLFGDAQITAIMSPEAELRRMLRIESAWTRTMGQSGVADPATCDSLADAILATPISPADLAAGTARDGLPVPALVQHLKQHTQADLHPLIHQGLTSQDVIDTALMLAVQEVLPLLRDRLATITATLDTLSATHGDRALMGYTRMQAALPVTTAHRIATWRRPVVSLSDRLPDLMTRAAILQWGGPVGLRDGSATGTGARFAANLGLRDPGHAWHADRLIIADIAGFLAALSGTLGKMGQDIALMAQTGAAAIRLSGGGGSSAMPHKQNPVLAELLITLARYNAGALGTIQQAMVHEQERSGAAWTLEWMVLPDMLRTTARSLTCARQTLMQIETMGQGD